MSRKQLIHKYGKEPLQFDLCMRETLYYVNDDIEVRIDVANINDSDGAYLGKEETIKSILKAAILGNAVEIELLSEGKTF